MNARTKLLAIQTTVGTMLSRGEVVVVVVEGWDVCVQTGTQCEKQRGKKRETNNKERGERDKQERNRWKNARKAAVQRDVRKKTKPRGGEKC